jgi:hypothetical protein
MVAAAWTMLLMSLPPGSSRLWGLNAFRALTPGVRVALVAAAAAVAPLALRSPRRVPAALLAAMLGAALALALAFPLRERLHFLGDSQLRMRAIAHEAANELKPLALRERAQEFHAQPLDLALDLMGPTALARRGWSAPDAVSVVSLGLAAVFFAGLWRLARVMRPAPDCEPAFIAVLAGTGLLQAFAGYAESTAVLLATAVWWWAVTLAPLDRWWAAARIALAWLMVFLAHRLGLVLLAPQLWRSLAPAFEGDRPAARRLLLILTLAEAAAAAMVLTTAVLPGGSLRDIRELLEGVLGPHGPRLTPPLDLVSLLAVVAAPALLAPALIGREGLATFARSRPLALFVVAALALSPMLFVYPVAPSGLGPHRDWDLASLPGLSLTAAAAFALSRLPASRLRGALVVLLPVLVLQAGGWVLANADMHAALLRAQASASAAAAYSAEQRSSLFLFLAYDAAEREQYAAAGGYFERAFDALPNRKNLITGAEAWLRAGDPAAARRVLARARAGPVELPPDLQRAAATLDMLILQSEAQLKVRRP